MSVLATMAIIAGVVIGFAVLVGDGFEDDETEEEKK